MTNRMETARRALGFVSPEDRDVWIRMGMALSSEFGDSGFELWDRWSVNAATYNTASAKTSWKSFNKVTKVGIGSLFSEAKANGFVFNREDVEIDPIKLAAEKAEREARSAKAEESRITAAKEAAHRAQEKWRAADKDGTSPYLERKQVAAESCRFLSDGAIIVPMIRYNDGEPSIAGFQQINADGSKTYSFGMDKHGAIVKLGDVVNGEDIYLGEGYATCGSVRAAMGYASPVFVCFDTSGLMQGAMAVRKMYPDSRLIFCADDDYLTGGNGIKKAQVAADAVANSLVFLPKFTKPRRFAKDDESLPMLKDVNDLQCAEGLDVLHKQLHEFVTHVVLNETKATSTIPAPLENTPPAEFEPLAIPSPAQLISHFSLIYPTTDVWDGLRRQRIKKTAFEGWIGKAAAKNWMDDKGRKNIVRESLPSLIGGRAVDGGGGKLAEMLDNLTLLRGTETVWDAIGQQVMTLGAVRADYTPDLSSKWQEHSLRKTIEAKNLVFDPTQQVDLAVHVNMFLGWPLSPKPDNDLVKPIIDLLYSLCSAEDNVDECVIWILRWLAFPLQHPGAKMQTALLMFGEKQGTGKSLFFQDVIKPIYGDYGVVASQHQLDSSFTAWRSRKLFVLFEEVLSREDKYSHNGTLKYMITGTEMSVNQKNLPERIEKNHLNSVFLSNEPQPIPIELEDRRFMVIEARKSQPSSFYDDVKQSINDGGIAAFYYFLLNFPLEDFNEHTKPIMTLAKERVIEFGLSSWMSFYRHWKDGYLDVPYCSCLTEDLYTIYKKWCDKSGEKALTMTRLNGFVGSREPKVKKSVAVGVKAKKSRMVYLVENPNEPGTLDEQVNRFRERADIRADRDA